MRFAQRRLVLMLILGVTTGHSEEGLDMAAVKTRRTSSRRPTAPQPRCEPIRE